MKQLTQILFWLSFLQGISPFVSAQHIRTLHFKSYQPEQPSICMVTIDPSIEKNKIIWEKKYDQGIISYNIYGESKAISENYDLIGNVPFSSQTQFTDSTSEPEMKKHKYRLTAVDTCGNETLPSAAYKTFFLQYVRSINGEAVLSWELSSIDGIEEVFNTIVIYRGTNPKELFPIDSIPGEYQNYVDSDEDYLFPCFTVYYRIGAINESACDPGILPGGIHSDQVNYEVLSTITEPGLIQYPCLGIESESNRPGISPNPLISESTITWKGEGSREILIQIINLNGKVIRSIITPDNSNYILQRGDLKSGCYFIRLVGKRTSIAKFFVI